MEQGKMKKADLLEGQSLDVVNENIQHLKEIFPEAFTENGVDFDVLRQLLGDAKVLDEGEEKYGLNWHGKKKARQIALTPSLGTLLPCPEESVDWDKTQNLFIEGDNLEVLKLLQKSYANKVKMIYIDPPYNTGGEFVYPDNYQDNLDTYLRYTGQKGEDGLKFSTNTESSGRKHTNWLNMMYPRLKLAKNLLKKDGVIFISIDDNEQSNLKALCDDIFGQENFIAQAGWQKVYSPKNQARYLSSDYEYILIYTKQINDFQIGLLPRTEEMNKRYSNPDNDPRGDWKAGDLVAAGERKEGHYIVKNPYTGAEHDVPQGKHWAFSQKSMLEMLADNRIHFGKNNDSFPSFKQFLSEVKQGRVASSLFSYKDYGHTDEAKKDFIKIFGDEGRTIFETLKPVKLIKQLMRLANLEKNDIILDFFAGSATTAQSVFNFNIEAEAACKFILVQIPEQTEEKSTAYQYGYKYISEIGKERIRRAGKKIKEENPDYNGDLGFKVFKLSSSNIKAWNPDASDIENSLLSHSESLVEGRKEQDILYELLLKRGVDLTAPIETKKVAGKTIYSIGYGVLFACLDSSIGKAEVEEVASVIIKWNAELKPSSETHVFFRDSAFADDIAKTNMAAILEQNGISHVRSL